MGKKEAQRSYGDGVVVNAKAALLDPLSNYWGLSLFPQTTLNSAPTSKPYNPEDDLHEIHNRLRSMVLQSPAKYMDQIKSIVNENPGLLNSEIPSDPTCDEENNAVSEEAEELLRKRRPALGFERARFSLKPARNPSIESLIPSLDIDKLKDPEEFFLAHERIENAKRELQKQMGGVSLEPSQDNTSTKLRQRRPGLLGNNQRSVKYKHRYPKETINNNNNVPSSQEAIGSVSPGPIGTNTDKDGGCLTPLENEVTDSPAIEENKINDILYGYLRGNPEDLEGDGAITLLQERLQIEPIVLEKSFVPDFPDNQVIDMKSLHGNLSKPRKRKALSNIHNLLKGINSRTPLRQDVASPMQQSASPTPPRSPFAPLSSLQKHISRSKPSVDPFSAHDIDHSSTRKYSPTHVINQELNRVGSGEPSNELSTCIIDDGIAVNKTSSVVDPVSNFASTSGKSKEDNSGISSTKLNETLIEDIIAVSKTYSAEDAVKNHASTPQKSTEDRPRELELDANIESNGPLVDMDVDIMNGLVGRPNLETDASSEVADKAERMQADAASLPTDHSNLNLVNQLDQSGPPGFQANDLDEGIDGSDHRTEQYLQEKTDGDSILPDNGQKRVKHARKQNKNKTFPRRQSLAAAGTSFNSGLRRSTRIRTRPLEFWKGERMVYGRVHKSLATVIGVKCISPGSDGKPTMKVKSYVSDQYKELLELASLY